MGRAPIARRARPVEFISHTPQLIEGMRFSTQEFYVRLERALAERQIPDLVAKRVIWKEGGVLSPGREYLRIRRERYVLDICAAPFGTGFFVSIWAAERPLRIAIWMWMLLLILLGAWCFFFAPYQWRFALFLAQEFPILNIYTASILSTAIGAGSIFLAAVVLVGLNLDLFLIGLPFIGYFYERYFRAITYYRVDLMCMYRAAVKAAVQQVIAEITTSQGISPPTEFSEKPVLRELLETVPTIHG